MAHQDCLSDIEIKIYELYCDNFHDNTTTAFDYWIDFLDYPHGTDHTCSASCGKQGGLYLQCAMCKTRFMHFGCANLDQMEYEIDPVKWTIDACNVCG